MNSDYSLIQVLETLAKWKKRIFIVTGLVGLLSVVGSLLMPNYYTSSAIVYAASPTLANPDPIGGAQKTFYTYGTGEDLDRLFSIANSGTIKNYIIQKYDLSNHYDIDTSSLKGKAKLALHFNKLYKTTKTKFDALMISVEDTDPNMARDMVRDIRIKIDETAQSLIKKSQFLTIKSLEEGIKNQVESLFVNGDSLATLKSKYKITESYDQASSYSTMMTEAVSELAEKEAKVRAMKQYRLNKDSINKETAKIEGLRNKITTTDSLIKVFNKGVLPIRQLETSQNKGIAEIALERERLKKLVSSYNRSFTTLHIVEKETVPFEKTRPKRMMIVLGLTMLAFVLSCLGVLLIEGTKEIDWRKIYAGK
jgi:uncharacterized protein involved in exopolysaccharide biosynthesis